MNRRTPGEVDELFAIDRFADDRLIRAARTAFLETTIVAAFDDELMSDPGAIHEAALTAAVRQTIAEMTRTQIAAFAQLFGLPPVAEGGEEAARADLDEQLAKAADVAGDSLLAALLAHKTGQEIDYPIHVVDQALSLLAAIRTAFGMDPTRLASEIAAEAHTGADRTGARDVMRLHLAVMHDHLSAVELSDAQAADVHAREHRAVRSHRPSDLEWYSSPLLDAYRSSDVNHGQDAGWASRMLVLAEEQITRVQNAAREAFGGGR